MTFVGGSDAGMESSESAKLNRTESDLPAIAMTSGDVIQKPTMSNEPFNANK